MGALLLDVGGRDDLGGEVQPLTEVVQTLDPELVLFGLLLTNLVDAYLGSQGVVVVLPREPGLDIAARVQGLARLDDLWEK